MIAHLKGHILCKTNESVIVEANGVGYEVFVPLSTLSGLNESNDPVSLYIYTHVREDTLSLFGFSSMLEKQVFQLLLSVSGIGPKVSLAMLSDMGARKLLFAISNKDGRQLQAVPGIGKKTADRIVLELKDKASRLLDSWGGSSIRTEEGGEEAQILNDAMSALLNLGYPFKYADQALKKAQGLNKGMDLETLIKEALKLLAS